MHRTWILILLFAGCTQAPADLGIPDVQVGDYWIYKATHNGEVISLHGASVAKEGTLNGQRVFLIQHFVEDPDKYAKAHAEWITADQASLASAWAHDLKGPLNSAFAYVAYDEPCQGRPPMESFSPMEIRCTGWSHFVDDEGSVFGMQPLERVWAAQWRESTTLEITGRSMDATLIEYRSTSRIDGVARESEELVWFSGQTCGAARSEAMEVVNLIVGYRCGGHSGGLSLQEAGLTAVPLMDVDAATLRPVQVTAECTMRPVYVQVAGARQDVFASSCDIAEQRTFGAGTVVGRLVALAEWEDDESVIIEGTLTIGDQSVQGTSPLELELLDVDGTFDGVDVRIDFEGVAFAPRTEIAFTFSDFHR